MTQLSPKEKDELTTIPIKKGIRDRMKELGRMNETYSDFIERLLDVYEKEKERARK